MSTLVRKEGKILGVAAGLASYFNIDETIVRIAFLLSLLLGGAGLIVYLIIAAVAPKA